MITAIADKAIIGRRQYPNTLMIQEAETPASLIKFRSVYMASEPTTPIP